MCVCSCVHVSTPICSCVHACVSMQTDAMVWVWSGAEDNVCSGSLLPPLRSQGLTQYIRLGSRHLCPVNDLTDS